MGKKAGEQAISEEAVRSKTGKVWEEWFALLDAWGAAEKGHTRTAKHLVDAHAVSPWWAQTITVRYEQERGLRVVGQRGDEFVATVQRTLSAPPEDAYAALTDPAILSRWFTKGAKADLRVGGRYENADGDRGEFLLLQPPERLRYTWENPDYAPGTLVEFHLTAKGPQKTTVRLEHSKLASQEDFEEMKLGWTWALECLKSFLETGEIFSFEEWREAHEA